MTTALQRAARAAVRRRGALVLLGVVLGPWAGCRSGRPAPPALSVTPGASVVAAGQAGLPVAVTYEWTAEPGFAGLSRSVRVFAHFVSPDGAVLVQDDHVPQPPADAWSGGGRWSYRRLVFTPRMFPGPLELRVGLFDAAAGARFTLRGHAAGRSAYRVATFTLAPGDGRRAAAFGRGWLPPDGNAHEPFLMSRWTRVRASLSFEHPRADALLFLRAWAPAEAGAALELAMGAAQATWPLSAGEPFSLAVRVGESVLGDGERCQVDLALTGGQPASRRLRLDAALLVPIEELPPELRMSDLGLVVP